MHLTKTGLYVTPLDCLWLALGLALAVAAVVVATLAWGI